MHLRHFESPALMWIIALLTIAACCIPVPVLATTEIAWHKPRFQYDGKDRSVREVLKRFAKAERLELSIDDGVTGRVTGRYDLSARQMLDTLAEEYYFSWHSDGKHLRITSLNVRFDGSLKLRLSDFGPVAAMENGRVAAAPVVGAPVATALEVGPAQAPIQVWTTTLADKTLQNALARWSTAAGWQLFWELPQDHSVEATASIHGTFEDAVAAVTRSLQSNGVPVKAIFFEGNRVLRIMAKGAQ